MYAAIAAGRTKNMYTLKMSYGYVDEPETATVEILGTYETRDEACTAAESKFDAIMERLGDDLDTRFRDIERGCGDYYVTYGYCDYELGCVVCDHYYEVSVNER